MSYLSQINSFLLLLDTITPSNPIQKAMEDAEINEELDEQQEILAAETDNSIEINELFETVYKAAEGALAPTTLSGYTGYISYIFLIFY
jgi:hypothetical protein